MSENILSSVTNFMTLGLIGVGGYLLWMNREAIIDFFTPDRPVITPRGVEGSWLGFEYGGGPGGSALDYIWHNLYTPELRRWQCEGQGYIYDPALQECVTSYVQH